jgi:hypothetical protein
LVAVLNTVFDDNGTSTTDDDVVVQYLNVDKQPFKIAVLNLVELPLSAKADVPDEPPITKAAIRLI